MRLSVLAIRSAVAIAVAIALFGLLPATLTFVAAQAAPAATDTLHHIDHIILAIGDLDAGIAEFERLTGVMPAKGGEHPNAGTQNALASLGGGHYLEILAPQATAPRDGEMVSLFATKKLSAWGWAVRSTDVSSSMARLKTAGLTTTGTRAGSRKTPSGAMLAWTTVGITTPARGFVPFLIQWGAATAHPSTTSPAGCRLLTVETGDTNTVALRSLIGTLAVPVKVVRSAHATLAFTLECPKGRVTFRSQP